MQKLSSSELSDEIFFRETHCFLAGFFMPDGPGSAKAFLFPFAVLLFFGAAVFVWICSRIARLSFKPAMTSGDVKMALFIGLRPPFRCFAGVLEF